MLTKILSWLALVQGTKIHKNQVPRPTVIPRAQHSLSRANISKAALKVLYRLKDAGFEAYLVGGGVRDVLLGLHPKDFDVATDAHPEEVKKLFQNCRLIGRRFRLAHIHFGPYIVEVATFRASAAKNSAHKTHLVHSKGGILLRDNIYGTLADDIFRRDFTVNALYYNIADFSLVDYVGGLKDLKEKRIRMIGDASQRYREDPVRMLRAIRFAAKLGFDIHPEAAGPIFELAALIKEVPSARLLHEYVKLFLNGFAQTSFALLCHYKVFGILFPQTECCLSGKQHVQVEKFIKSALQDTDRRVTERRPVALPFLLAAFLWYPLQEEIKHLLAEEFSEVQAFYEAGTRVLKQQQKNIIIPKRLIQTIREIWALQVRLTKRTGKRAFQVYAHPRFRAGYDFLCLRAATGEPALQDIVKWWEAFVVAHSPLQ